MLDKLSRFMWLQPHPSSSNFVLFHVVGPFSAAQIALLLRKFGVLVRYFSTTVLKDYIRISVGRPSDTNALVAPLQALENTWKILEEYVPEALIFDMDGVIADVSQSYRQAIIDTCKYFSADVTNQGINSISLLPLNVFDEKKILQQRKQQETQTTIGFYHYAS